MEILTGSVESIYDRLRDNHYTHGNGKPTYFAVLDTPTGGRVIQHIDRDQLLEYISRIEHSAYWIFTIHSVQ
jgi:hypothetical protein